MKVYILLALLSGFIFSCSVSKEFVSSDLIGSFYGVSNGSMPNTSIQYSLELKTDNVFNIKIQVHVELQLKIGDFFMLPFSLFPIASLRSA